MHDRLRRCGKRRSWHDHFVTWPDSGSVKRKMKRRRATRNRDAMPCADIIRESSFELECPLAHG
jgi:hypothetical protein